MKTSLVIDRGNSTLKASLFQGNKCVRSTRIGHDGDIRKGLTNLITNSHPQNAIYSSTSDCQQKDLEAVESVIGFRPLVFDHSTPVPVTLNYSTPHTLGLDRIASATGAWNILKEKGEPNFLLVADAGTALTLDIVDRNAIFHGGNISAGLRLRLDALSSHTSALPQISIEGDVPAFGYDTATAMRSGAVNGVKAEIEHSFLTASALYGAGAIVLTGGDADLLYPRIKSSYPVILSPTLVAAGLNCILDYNENNCKTY